MVALRFLLACPFLLTVAASPLSGDDERFLRFPTFDPKELLCQLPFVRRILCPPRGLNNLQVVTAIGMAYGTQATAGATRFTVKYAHANRWAPSKLAPTWSLPPGSINATSLPLACPQPDVDPSAYTEDCLSMVMYVPNGLTSSSSAPILMWIHGGSFVVGSAVGPGLDGSSLAVATNSIVAVVQYRLGALGFLSPDGTTNLAVKDVINAMKFLQRIAPSFGGSPSKITLAGQSSGANMIRALLATPSASSLFKSAILQSDPMNYGFLSPKTQTSLQTNFNNLINCAASDTSCRNALSVSSILTAQTTLFGQALGIDPSAGAFEPFRPVLDGALITSPLDSTQPFPGVSKPLLLSTVLNEAGFAIYQQFTDPLPQEVFPPICAATFGDARTTTIVGSQFYVPVPLQGGGVDSRTQLQLLGTDYLWRCSSWTLARNWVAHGGAAYVGQYEIGASYPGNDAVPYCTGNGVVCHQDDIQIVFGTAPNPTAAQTAFIKEIQARYKAFLYNGNPNAAGYATWNPATSSDVHALRLGGTGEVSPGACVATFWGQAVQYDYQYYDI